MNQSILAFNNGEVTPYLRHRIDYDKTASSAEEMTNFLPMPYGGVIKRPGLASVAETAEVAGENSRLLPFIASDGTRYLLHFTVDVLTIYGTDGAVKDTLAFMDGYEWPETHSWQDSIRDLHMEQVNDVAFFTHPGSFPLRLSRNADTDWTLEFLPFSRPPLNDENLDETKTFTVASNPVAATWANGASYTVGDKAFTNSEWICISPHTAGAGNRPGQGTSWREFWRQMFYEEGDPVTILCDDRSEVAWQDFAYQGYIQDQLVTGLQFTTEEPPNVSVFMCLAGHTTDGVVLDGSGVNPGIDPNDDMSESLPTVEPWLQAAPWINSTTYLVGWCYHHNGQIYKCILEHAGSNPDYEPGVGVDTLLAWEPIPGASWLDFADLANWTEGTGTVYSMGDRVSVSGRVFVCNQGYDTTNPATRANTNPGIGVDWEDYWEEVSRVVPSFSAGPFSPGQYFMIAPNRPATDFQIERSASASGISDQIVVQGAWNFYTYGTWNGTFELQRSINNGITWETQRSWEGKGDRNIADAGVEDSPVILRLKYTRNASPDSLNPPRGLLVPDNTAVKGYALMDTYVGPDSMTGFAKTPMLSGNTPRWAYGAFNERDGYPRALCLHESRLVFGGTRAKPVSLWLSAADDLDNFETGPEADDGIFATLALSAASPIRWLASQRRLFIGTALSEWVCGSETSDSPITPENFMARQYTAIGSLPLQALIIADGLFFLERKGTRLRDYGYSYEREGYDGADLSRLAEHLTSPGISCFSWQQTREPGLWVVRRDGVLLHFAFSRSENIRAWSQHATSGGTFLDVCVLPSDEGDDEVFFIVRRDAASYLERFPQHWQAAYEEGTGYLCEDPGNTPVVSRLRGLPIDTGADDGSTQARRKRIHKFCLNLYQSAGGHVWNRNENLSQPISGGSELLSGWVDIVPDAGALDDVQLNIEHAAAYPFILRAACLRWQLNER